MSLPDPCDECRGDWLVTCRGVKRCTCARGVALRELDEMRKQPAERSPVVPRISEESAMAGVSMLSVIPFFPGEGPARMLIADELQQMASSDDQMLWTIKRVVRLFRQWPGVMALRHVFCSKFTPLDRINPQGSLEEFPEGIPVEIEPPRPEFVALPPGHSICIDPAMEQAVKLIAESKDMNQRFSVNRPLLQASAMISANQPMQNPITQADIDAAVQKVRDERGRQELNPPAAL